MSIQPVTTTPLESASFTEVEGNEPITNIASGILSAIHGEVKVDISLSLDLPKIAEVLKAQLVATGASSGVLWALASVESDPTKTVEVLAERIEYGEEDFGWREVAALHLLHKKAPKLEKRLLDAFLTQLDMKADFGEGGLLQPYLMQKGHREEFDRLIAYYESLVARSNSPILNFHEPIQERVVGDISESLIIMSLVSGFGSWVRPLQDLDPAINRRLGLFMASCEKNTPLVEPEHFLMARLLQGQDIESIAQSCADPTYRAMVYDSAAVVNSIKDPKLAEELLGQSMKLIGEADREISYTLEDGLNTNKVQGTPLEMTRMLIAGGLALQGSQAGASYIREEMSKGTELEEIYEIFLGIFVFVLMAASLYRGERAIALELLDGLIAQYQKLDEEDEDGEFEMAVMVLSALFPERKEELRALISNEVPDLGELTLLLNKENIARTIKRLSEAGIIDLGESEVLAGIASVLGLIQ